MSGMAFRVARIHETMYIKLLGTVEQETAVLTSA